MSKKSARPIGEVKITRGETDDEALVHGVATWKLEAGNVWAYIQCATRSPREFRYNIGTARRDGNTLRAGPDALIRERDFAAAVAEAKRLMAIARDAR